MGRPTMLLLALMVGGVVAERGLVDQLHGSGSTNPSRLLWKAAKLVEDRTKLPVQATYRAIGSGNGQTEFIAALNNFVPLNHYGCGDIPLSQTNYDQMTTAGRQFIHLPMLVGAISYFHSMPTVGLSGPLALSPCTLAKIFQRNITRWNDPVIVAENPELAQTDQGIKVLVRADGSSSTSLSSQYLSEVCPSEYVIGAGKGGRPDRAPFWPVGVDRVEGSGNMLNALRTTPYAIGYLDTGHGNSQNVPEVALTNANGQTLLSSDADVGIAAASNDVGIPAVPTDSWANVNLVDARVNNAWPIVTFSYLYIDTNLTSIYESGALLKALAKFLLSTEVQNSMLSEFGFFPLPQALLQNARVWVDNLVLAPNVTEFTFETATTTLVGTGAGKYVISGKRQGWNSHVLKDFTENVEEGSAIDLQHNDSISALQARVASLQASASASSCSCDNSNTAAIAAIIISIIAIVATSATFFVLSARINSARTANVPTFQNPNYDMNDAKVAPSMDGAAGQYLDVGTEAT